MPLPVRSVHGVWLGNPTLGVPQEGIADEDGNQGTGAGPGHFLVLWA